jgi:hypothetical protein
VETGREMQHQSKPIVPFTYKMFIGAMLGWDITPSRVLSTSHLPIGTDQLLPASNLRV